MKLILEDKRPRRTPEISDVIWETMQDCWKARPNERLSASDIVWRLQSRRLWLHITSSFGGYILQYLFYVLLWWYDCIMYIKCKSVIDGDDKWIGISDTHWTCKGWDPLGCKQAQASSGRVNVVARQYSQTEPRPRVNLKRVKEILHPMSHHKIPTSHENLPNDRLNQLAAVRLRYSMRRFATSKASQSMLLCSLIHCRIYQRDKAENWIYWRRDAYHSKLVICKIHIRFIVSHSVMAAGLGHIWDCAFDAFAFIALLCLRA